MVLSFTPLRSLGAHLLLTLTPLVASWKLLFERFAPFLNRYSNR